MPVSEATVDERGTESWTCERCDVTVQWMSEHVENARLPAHWSQDGDLLHCLGCRRDLAAESIIDGLPESTPLAERVKLKARARVEFEINRDPERPNGKIAKSCRTSAASVQKARDRMAEAL